LGFWPCAKVMARTPFNFWKPRSFLRHFVLPLIFGLPGLILWEGFTGITVWSQELPPPTDPTGRFGQRPPITEKLPKPEPLPDILPKEGEQVPFPRLPTLKTFIREIQVIGSTVFSSEQLEPLIKPFVNRELTTEDLEDLRRKLTTFYIERGYVSSGAVIPDQDVSDGVLRLQVIEGSVTDIQVTGTNWFWPWYFSSRIAQSTGPPVNLHALRDRMQLFLQDPRIGRMNAKLLPGTQPGEGMLDIHLEETSPWKAWLEFNNYQHPTVGAERGLATISHLNPLGLGDAVSFTYGRSQGVDPLLDASYSVPLTPWDTTLILQYRQFDFEVVESPFKPLNITSNTRVYSLSLRQPVYRTPSQEFAITLTGEHLINENFLLGIPFAFTPGATEQGRFNISALRFSQEWTGRKPNQVLAARSRFSWGLDVLNATTSGSSQVADAQFFSWLGQVQGARRFDPYGIQLIGRMDLQIANDRLFPLEQYPMGGRFTVRGYRENTLVRDNAFLFSVESRLPIFPKLLGEETIQLAPFIDVGRAWNAKGGTPDPQTLASIGVGLRFTYGQNALPIFKNMFANIYWGHQLNRVPDRNQNLQDHGIHLQVLFEVL
jgi:hemolysin activation/secretion protein